MPTYDAKSIPSEAVRSTLDPALAKWLPEAPALGGHETVAEMRVSHDKLLARSLPPIGWVEYLGLQGPHGTLNVRCYHPSKDGPGTGGALVYMHGGGWTVGTLDQFEAPMRIFAEDSGVQVYIVEYRLAPEYKFPVQIEENEFVVRWLFEHAAERGVDPARIALSGDSAGGNMTCVIAQKLRDEGGPRLALQMPLYPECALPFETKAGVQNRTGLYLETAGVLLFAWCLIPQGVDYSQPYITPNNAKNFADLPKTILVTNGFDPLRDTGHAYAQKLAASGNDITYVHHEDLTHGFIQFTEHSPRCLEATRELARMLGEALRA